MCAKKEILKFDVVWEDCIQEETRVANREALLKEDDQSLATHAKRRRTQPNFKKGNHKESQPPKRFQRIRESFPKRDYSKFQCFNCDKVGHIAINCPLKKEEYKKRNNNKRHREHLAEDKDEEEEEEGPWRKQAREEDAEEYVLFSALSGFVTPGEHTWLIDSDDSKHIIGQNKIM